MPKFHGLDTSGLSIGQIIMLSHNAALPFGMLPCLGAQVSRTSYAALFKRIGTTWGYGDGATTFHTPSVAGQFPRFSDGIAAVDVDSYYRAPLVVGTFTIATCSTTSGSDVVTVPSTSNLAVGTQVTGAGIPSTCTVFAILSSTTFRLGSLFGSSPVNASSTNASTSLIFSMSVSGPFAGTYQGDVFSSHNHGGGDHSHPVPFNINGYLQAGSYGTTAAAPLNATFNTYSSGAIISAQGGNETRPKNVALRAAIAYI